MSSSTEEGRAALRLFHEMAYRELIAQHKVKTCINCRHFEDNKCNKWDATPPAETIVYGCEVWESEIPF